MLAPFFVLLNLGIITPLALVVFDSILREQDIRTALRMG